MLNTQANSPAHQSLCVCVLFFILPLEYKWSTAVENILRPEWLTTNHTHKKHLDSSGVCTVLTLSGPFTDITPPIWEGKRKQEMNQQRKGGTQGAIVSFPPLRRSLTFSHQDLNCYKHLRNEYIRVSLNHSKNQKWNRYKFPYVLGYEINWYQDYLWKWSQN